MRVYFIQGVAEIAHFPPTAISLISLESNFVILVIFRHSTLNNVRFSYYDDCLIKHYKFLLFDYLINILNLKFDEVDWHFDTRCIEEKTLGSKFTQIVIGRKSQFWDTLKHAHIHAYHMTYSSTTISKRMIYILSISSILRSMR